MCDLNIGISIGSNCSSMRKCRRTFSILETILGSRAGHMELLHDISDEGAHDVRRGTVNEYSLIHGIACGDTVQYVIVVDLHHLRRLVATTSASKMRYQGCVEGSGAWLTLT